MKTKIFLAALSIVLGLSVVSCGNNKAKSTTEEKSCKKEKLNEGIQINKI